MSEQLYLTTELKKELERLGLDSDLGKYVIFSQSRMHNVNEISDLIVLEKILRDLKNNIVTIKNTTNGI
jgi:ABC-type uncharacterized transport system ATPase subunit